MQHLVYLFLIAMEELTRDILNTIMYYLIPLYLLYIVNSETFQELFLSYEKQDAWPFAGWNTDWSITGLGISSYYLIITLGIDFSVLFCTSTILNIIIFIWKNCILTKNTWNNKGLTLTKFHVVCSFSQMFIRINEYYFYISLILFNV